MESVLDQTREADRRRLAGLLFALTALLVCLWWRPGPFPIPLASAQVGLCLGFVLAWRPGDRFLTASWRAAPPPLRPGNPVFRGPSLSWYWLLGLFFVALGLSCQGVTSGVASNQQETMASAFLPFFCAALAWMQLLATRTWHELDVSNLKVWRHRVLFGMRRTMPASSEPIRFVAVARTASTQEFEVYVVFRGEPWAIALDCHTYREEEALFQAGRLGDTLMVPVLENYRHQSIDMVLAALQREGEQAFRFRRDWEPMRVPADLDNQQSVLPPLP